MRKGEETRNRILDVAEAAVLQKGFGGTSIEELIVDGENGLLVEPGDRSALAAAITRLIGDPPQRTKLGANGAARLGRDFSLEHGIDRLAEKFGLKLAQAPAATARAAGSR